jgi:hypothetical protein
LLLCQVRFSTVHRLRTWRKMLICSTTTPVTLRTCSFNLLISKLLIVHIIWSKGILIKVLLGSQIMIIIIVKALMLFKRTLNLASVQVEETSSRTKVIKSTTTDLISQKCMIVALTSRKLERYQSENSIAIQWKRLARPSFRVVTLTIETVGCLIQDRISFMIQCKKKRTLCKA